MYQGLTTEPQLPQLDVYPARHQRRLTVFFRLLLLIPQLIVVWLLGIVTFFVAIAAWFAALVLGRLPQWAAEFLAGYVAYSTRVYASLYLLVDSYPPFAFAAPESPVQVDLHPGGLNRLAVLFRIILVIPAAIIASIVTSGWHALAFFCWLAVLILGRTPEPLFNATTAILRYEMRLQAYFLMLSSAYPKRLFGDPEAAGALPQGTVVRETPAGEAETRTTETGDTGLRDTPPQGNPQAAGTAGQPDPDDGLPRYSEPQETPPDAWRAEDPAQPGPGDAGVRATGPQPAGLSPTRPLLLTTGGKVLLAVFIVAGLAAGLGSGFGSDNNNTTVTTTTSSTGHP